MSDIIKQIEVNGTTYDIYDEYARRRIEGLTSVYSIDIDYAGTSVTDQYVDWDTEEVLYIAPNRIKNSAFKSANADITITREASGSSLYVCLTSTKTVGSSTLHYAKELKSMHLGDTIYGIQSKTATPIYPDRWLSGWTEDSQGQILSGTFSALDGKIDLSEYAKKTVAGKAGTYTSSVPSTTVTGSAGSQTATGTATITYNQAATVTGSAGASSRLTQTVANSTVTIQGSSFSFTGTSSTISIPVTAVTLKDHSFTPSGTIGGSVTIAAHSHTINYTTSTLEVAIIENIDGEDQEWITSSAGAHSHTIGSRLDTLDVAKGSLTGSTGSHSHSIDTHAHSAIGVNVVSDVTATTTSIHFYNTVSPVTDEAVTAATVTQSATANYMYSPTVSTTGVLSWSLGKVVNGVSITRGTFVSEVLTQAQTETVVKGIDLTKATVASQPSAATINTKSAGSHSHSLTHETIQYIGQLDTETGSVAAHTHRLLPDRQIITYVTGGTVSGAGAHTIQGSSFSFTGASVSLAHSYTTRSSVTLTSVFTPSGTIGGSVSINPHTHSYTPGYNHTHTIDVTATTVTGTAAVAVVDHNHTISHTHTVTISNCNS